MARQLDKSVELAKSVLRHSKLSLSEIAFRLVKVISLRSFTALDEPHQAHIAKLSAVAEGRTREPAIFRSRCDFPQVLVPRQN
jgi:hypothetical protein